MVTNDPLAVVALGGIKVDVNDEDAARAHEIIAAAAMIPLPKCRAGARRRAAPRTSALDA